MHEGEAMMAWQACHCIHLEKPLELLDKLHHPTRCPEMADWIPAINMLKGSLIPDA